MAAPIMVTNSVSRRLHGGRERLIDAENRRSTAITGCRIAIGMVAPRRHWVSSVHSDLTTGRGPESHLVPTVADLVKRFWRQDPVRHRAVRTLNRTTFQQHCGVRSDFTHETCITQLCRLPAVAVAGTCLIEGCCLRCSLVDLRACSLSAPRTSRWSCVRLRICRRSGSTLSSHQEQASSAPEW